VGWNETEYRAFGFPFDRVARFEGFTIIRRPCGGRRLQRVLPGSRTASSPGRHERRPAASSAPNGNGSTRSPCRGPTRGGGRQQPGLAPPAASTAAAAAGIPLVDGCGSSRLAAGGREGDYSEGVPPVEVRRRSAETTQPSPRGRPPASDDHSPAGPRPPIGRMASEWSSHSAC
jgi:hypothetical protein